MTSKLKMLRLLRLRAGGYRRVWQFNDRALGVVHAVCTLGMNPGRAIIMRLCYFDSFSGISGDMTVGALLDAGAEWKALEDALHSLQLNASFRLEKTKRKGIAASKFSVDGGEQKAHRHLPHIEKIIAAGDLTERARTNALAVFRKLGEAEAKSHSVPIEKVHFHEVGAVDSICDIVGACVALDLLGIDEVRSSRINVGSGTVNTEHGVLPVPAPATAEMLRGLPIYSAGPEAELTTPTGAALISTLAKGFGGAPAIRMLSQGFGAGDKDFPGQANVLRVLVGEKTSPAEATTVTVIEANIDDSTPQVLGYAMDRLFENGRAGCNADTDLYEEEPACDSHFGFSGAGSGGTVGVHFICGNIDAGFAGDAGGAACIGAEHGRSPDDAWHCPSEIYGRWKFYAGVRRLPADCGREEPSATNRDRGSG